MSWSNPLLTHSVLTHVEGYSDDVERHGGVSDAAERRRLTDRQIEAGREGDRWTERQDRKMRDTSVTGSPDGNSRPEPGVIKTHLHR